MHRVPAAAVAILLAATTVAGADWPAWRGPLGSGVSPETGLPDRWSATENVAWKARLAGVGVSSPIVSGDYVYVTSQVGAGVRQPGNHPRLAQGGSASGSGERALESAAAGGSLVAGSGETQLFVTPGYRFRVVESLLTNFHLPRSTLLMLIAAFAGLDAVLAAYRHAVAQRYRFFSYGDAMFIHGSRTSIPLASTPDTQSTPGLAHGTTGR